MRYCVFFLILLLACPSVVCAQSEQCDSLSVRIAGHAQEDTTRMMLLYQLAWEKRYYNTAESEKLVEDACRIATKTQDKRGIVEGLRQKAGLNCRKANYDQAKEQYKEAIKLADKAGQEWEKAKLEYDLGRLYSSIYQFDEALTLFNEALGVFKKLEDRSNIVRCLFNMGKIAMSKNDQKSAMAYYMDGLKLADSWGLKKDKALIYSNLGALYFGINEQQRALDYFQKALLIYEELKDASLLAGAYQQLGTVCIVLKKEDEAKVNLLKSRDLFKKLGYKSQLRHALNSLGVLAKNQEKYAEAMLYYEEIYQFAKDTRDTLWEATGLINMGSLNITFGNYSKALRETREAEKLSAQMGYTDKQLIAYENIALIYELQHKYKEALEWHRKFKIYGDTIFNEEKFKQIEELRTQYDVERKELKIENLEAMNRVQHLTLQRTRISVGSMTLLFIVSLFFGIFFRKQYRKTMEANRNLVIKNQEILFRHEKYLEQIREMEIERTVEENNRKEESTVSQETRMEMIENLERIFMQEKIFKDSELTLVALAKLLNTNTSYLSRAINDYYGQNFSNFINTYRVNAAQKMLMDSAYDPLTIEAIAQEVGFNSKSSFNTAFKNITGLTPSAYKKGRG